MAKTEMKFCDKCRTALKLNDNFYKTNNKEKYPDGYLNTCKKCMTMHVDNWNPETFLPILEECDVPYIPKVWNKLLKDYAQDPEKVTGLTIIGRYLSNMKLNQYAKWRWKDTEYLQKVYDHELEEAMKRAGYEMSEIDEAVKSSNQITVEQPVQEPVEDYFAQQYDDSIDDLNLTDEDKNYLRLKWGKLYKPDEWVALEQLYKDMEDAYGVKAPGDLNSLKIVCKVSLKINQLIDIGDIDGAQKAQKMYDSLMKSGKWTAAQLKLESGEVLNSVSEIVAICESEGFIPRFYTSEPNDRVDETIRDMKNYTRSLVVDEMNLGNLIENAVKQMAIEEAKAEDEDIEDEEIVFDELEDSDYEEYNDFVEDGKEADEDYIRKLIEMEDD